MNRIEFNIEYVTEEMVVDNVWGATQAEDLWVAQDILMASNGETWGLRMAVVDQVAAGVEAEQ